MGLKKGMPFWDKGGKMQQKKSITMKDMPTSEKPYEKCIQYGASALSDAELLAVVIRTGTGGERCTELATRVLHELPCGNLSGLFKTSLNELTKINGIGNVKAVQLICLAEISRRIMSFKVPKNLDCSNPKEIAKHYIVKMRYLETEQVILLVLDARNMLKKEIVLSNGSFTSAFVSPREVYYNAIKHGAIAVILMHNHPSGDPTPSREDLQVTKKILEAGYMLDIPLLDHIIIGDDSYISFKESSYGIR